MATMIERVAAAIDAADVGYSLRLTRLVDEVSTYTLMYSDGVGPFEFEDIDDGYAHVRDRKFAAKARAAIAAMREPTEGMLDAPLQYDPHAIVETSLGTIDARNKYESRRDLRPFIFRAMIEAALEEKP